MRKEIPQKKLEKNHRKNIEQKERISLINLRREKQQESKLATKCLRKKANRR